MKVSSKRILKWSAGALFVIVFGCIQVAYWLPAHRAGRMNPIQALHAG